ncbi:DUF4364 family protein [Peptoniphilus sp. AGMB00490]|uniref:DUF4364 family protein n=2 Tax=Peptoniphilus TaxID=162289 RepID=A0ACD6AZX4_9FIRM|nr:MULTISPECIES: DUF4364 family protein [Peptoniphilus]NMW84946.1 DUF4364 family protein [Peptoniphilus faecalis]OLR65493.1 hypothetical protein BIV18_08175 [Peptoniphilus porci]
MKKSSFELALNKLLILYIIDNFSHKLKENDLSYFVLDIELFNYFYFKQYLKELESTGLVLFDRDKKYYLSDDGVKTLDIFYEKIPEENIKFLDEKMKKYRHELLLQNSITSEIYEEKGTGYTRLKIKDGEIDVLDLKIEVSDLLMAKKISANFKKNAENIYSKILKLLTEDKN